MRVIPTFAISFGFLNLSLSPVFDSSNYSKTAGDILFLWIAALLSTTILLAFELFKVRKGKRWETQVPKESEPLDNDVEEEMQKVDIADEDYGIKIKGLRKVYHLGKKKYKVAVDKLSLGIKNGECFTLLGVSGAGKTTAFKLMTGELPPTEGDILVQGYSVTDKYGDARRYIGYCPQFDALFDLLTAKEHLEFYCKIKGIPSRMIPALVDKQLRELNLIQFKDIPAGTYSGGNKRKLSVGIALIGNPPIVFLDEPSTGMDPEARRYMWDVISRISKGTSSDKKGVASVMLTTHSMEEAEALATRIAIQVDGGLKCLGTAQHIKAKYGGGFEIEMKVDFPTRQAIEDGIKELKMQKDIVQTKEEILSILGKVNMLDIENELREDGSGGGIFMDLKKKRVEMKSLMEWILVEKKGKKAIEELSKKFRGFIVLDKFLSILKVRVAADIHIGDVFEILEGIKDNLGIIQYSVKESTIEQIFNQFASHKLAVKTKNMAHDIEAQVQPVNSDEGRKVNDEY